MPSENIIKIAGEQAEVFEDQMNVDRELMEATDDCIAFRPQIDGEWNDFVMPGSSPPCFLLADPDTGEIFPGPYNWTCIIDLGKAIKNQTAPSGLRIRAQCPEPATPALREALREIAIEFAEVAILRAGGKTGKKDEAVWVEPARRERPKRGFGK